MFRNFRFQHFLYLVLKLWFLKWQHCLYLGTCGNENSQDPPLFYLIRNSGDGLSNHNLTSPACDPDASSTLIKVLKFHACITLSTLLYEQTPCCCPAYKIFPFSPPKQCTMVDQLSYILNLFNEFSFHLLTELGSLLLQSLHIKAVHSPCSSRVWKVRSTAYDSKNTCIKISLFLRLFTLTASAVNPV